ncbi:hypothetical protein OSTOST_00580, partial [Ostertagia ostertagi]
MRDENMVNSAEDSLKKLLDKNNRDLNIDDGYLRFDSSADPEPQSHFCRVVNKSGNTEIKFTDQPSCMGRSDGATTHNGKSYEASNSESTNADDAFFDLLSRMQSARLDEQRCDLSIITSRTGTGRRQTDSLMATQNDDSFVIPEDRKSLLGRVRDTLARTARRSRKNRDGNRSNTSMTTDEGTNSYKGSFDSINTLATHWVTVDTPSGEQKVFTVDFQRNTPHGEHSVPPSLKTLFEDAEKVEADNLALDGGEAYSKLVNSHGKQKKGKAVTIEFVENSPMGKENIGRCHDRYEGKEAVMIDFAGISPREKYPLSQVLENNMNEAVLENKMNEAESLGNNSLERDQPISST